MDINFPVSMEKTYWANTVLTFLGMLIDTERQMVMVPVDKIAKALEQIDFFLSKRKVTVKQVQKLCGLLNFICKGVVPGRAFTRRLYSYCGTNLKPHYHLRVSGEMKSDFRIWCEFLNHPTVYCRPFLDFDVVWNAVTINMYSDATTNPRLVMGAICQASWMFQRWNKNFIMEKGPALSTLNCMPW